MGKQILKSQGGRLEYYICLSKEHLKRNCLKNNRKKSTGFVKKDDLPSSNGLIYDSSEVRMVMSAKALLDWIIDLEGSYHMHPVPGELNVSVEKKDSLAQVWHKRLGHINEGRKAHYSRSDRLCSFRLMGSVSGGIIGRYENGLVEEMNVTLLAKIHCFIQSDMAKVFSTEEITMSTYLVNRSPSSTIIFKTPIDMLEFFGWLASIKQGMLELVKFKCIFLGYRKGSYFLDFSSSGHHSSITVTRLLTVVNMSLTDINASL
nr:retrovirus-related Pol polyprotein from transposon TNT 1-94 [Tanacetum cinerariifolium]